MTMYSATANLANRERRCAWSGIAADDLVEVEVATLDRWGRAAGTRVFRVRPQYREPFLAFTRFAVRYVRWLVPTMALSVSVLVVAGEVMGIAGVGVGLALVGATGVLLPFATPETVWILGVRKSVLVARVLGAGLAVGGAILAVAARI